MLKVLDKSVIQGPYLNLIKVIYSKAIANIKLNGEKLESISLNICFLKMLFCIFRLWQEFTFWFTKYVSEKLWSLFFILPVCSVELVVEHMNPSSPWSYLRPLSLVLTITWLSGAFSTVPVDLAGSTVQLKMSFKALFTILSFLKHIQKTSLEPGDLFSFPICQEDVILEGR